MPVKFARLRFGRNRPKTLPRWHFHNYTTRGLLAAPPATEDWSAAATASLSNIYLNGQLSNCVIAGGYHQVGLWTGNAGDLFLATDAQIISDYSAIGGYVPGNPATDQGCNEQTALGYWTSTGFADGSKLAGWMGVDATQPTLIQQGIYLFESSYYGLELPDEWTNPMPQQSGFIWDVAGEPNPEQGHAIMAIGYTAEGVVVDSWGMTGLVTWAALAKYMVTSAGGEAYVLVSEDQLNKAQAKAPNGFDWTTLISDFDSLGGNLPVPNPTPVPTPVPPAPTPSPTPTPVNPPTPIPPGPVPIPTPVVVPDIGIFLASKTIQLNAPLSPTGAPWVIEDNENPLYKNLVRVNLSRRAVVVPEGWEAAKKP
jgi:hypothetical protein